MTNGTPQDEAQPFQILSLSGGGFLGLYTVEVLEDLERHCDAPIAMRFDLMAGTSIGGIIALALAGEVPARRIREAFEENGEKIFGSSPAPRSWIATVADILRRFSQSKYKADALRATVDDIVGSDMRIGDLRHPVIVPAINLSRGAPQVFKTPHHQDFRIDLNRRVTDVAMATSAAPTYFPLATVADCQYADGGLFANSPDILAVHEAIHFFQIPEQSIRLLSIGTTTSRFSFAHAKNPRFGIWHWFNNARLMNVTIASQQKSVDFMMAHRLGTSYLRLDQDQSKEQERVLALDVATQQAQKTIKALARGTFQNSINNPVLALILAHDAAEPRFFE